MVMVGKIFSLALTMEIAVPCGLWENFAMQVTPCHSTIPIQIENIKIRNNLKIHNLVLSMVSLN